jgi:hypothetical protein
MPSGYRFLPPSVARNWEKNATGTMKAVKKEAQTEMGGLLGITANHS